MRVHTNLVVCPEQAVDSVVAARLDSWLKGSTALMHKIHTAGIHDEHHQADRAWVKEAGVKFHMGAAWTLADTAHTVDEVPPDLLLVGGSHL